MGSIARPCGRNCASTGLSESARVNQGQDNFIGTSRGRSNHRVPWNFEEWVDFALLTAADFLLHGGVVLISIDERYVESAAPNVDATKNGLALVIKGKFQALHIDTSETVLFGECQGSGKEPYRFARRISRGPTSRPTAARVPAG